MREGIFCDIISTSSWTKWSAQEGWWDINREEECDCYRNVLPSPASDLSSSNFTVCRYIFAIPVFRNHFDTAFPYTASYGLMSFNFSHLVWHLNWETKKCILKNARQMAIHITWGWLCPCLIWVKGQEAPPECEAEYLHPCSHRLTSLLRHIVFWRCVWLFIKGKHAIKMLTVLNAASISNKVTWNDGA